MFGWLKRKNIPKEDRVILHNHDLTKWNYIGYVGCHYVDENNAVVRDYNIFLFVNKEDFDKRSYHVTSSSVIPPDGHRYFERTVKTWAAGEGNFYGIINGKSAGPSDFLKNYMKVTYESVWSNKTNWWVSDDQVKYEVAVEKQKESVPEGKVISVDFGNKS